MKSNVDFMSDSHQPDAADLDLDLPDLATRVFDLARQGDTGALAAYVDAGVPADLADDKGDSLIMLAACHGHLDAVRVLLERGADPNRANAKGQTPLAGAVFKGAEKIARILFGHGADPATGTPSAIDAAAIYGRAEMVELFLGK